jgi:hypothetical protein
LSITGYHSSILIWIFECQLWLTIKTAKNFAEIAFSTAVKEMQEKPGSRMTYAITPRYTVEDFHGSFSAQRNLINNLEKKLKDLELTLQREKL